MIKILTKYFILILFFIMFIMVIKCFDIQASSQVWQNYGYNDVDLYNFTNTYNYNKNIIKETYITPDGEKIVRDYVANYFDMSTRNSELVTTNKPLLTVLTHGMGGSAKDWSLKNNQFTYCDDSLITRLSNVVPSGANIYWYVVENKVLKIYDIGIQNEEIKKGVRTQYTMDYEIEKITDLSKPIIIIFQTDEKYEYNNKVYEDFNYAVSKAVYDVKHLSNGVLPKINLIGHSRGGLTNLQYALDHPELVDSIFSIGTPYLGSTSAMVDFGILDAIGSNIGGGEGTGEEDIVNSNRYMEYYNRWNNNYNNLYSHINVTAIGGYSSMSFLKHIFMSDYAKNEMNGVTRASIMVVLELIQDAQIIYNVSKSVLSEDWLSDRMLKASEDLLEIIGSFSYATALADILTNEIKFDDDYPYVCWFNDGLVDLDSQLGTIKLNNNLANSIYKGFDRLIIKFTEDNSDFNKVAQNDLPIVHNLETRDDKIINIIINKITLSGKTASDYETYIVNDTEIGIKTILKNTNEESLIIPSSIDGKTVVEIANYAFSNNFNGNTSIKSIVVPNTIRKIGNNAFENCIYIENVSFSSNSQLNFLGNYAFMNCTNLNMVLIPSTVSTIGDFIFLNCENLKQYSYNNNTFYNIGSLNCRSSTYSNTHFLDKGYSMFLSFYLECSSRYDFNVESDEQINILLYDEEMNIIFDQPISKNNHTDESIIKDLAEGIYFIKVDFVDSTTQSNLKVTLQSRSNNVEELKVDESKNVLTHLHNNHNEYVFMKNKSGFYKITLNGESDSPLIYSSGMITVFDNDDNVVDKLEISDSIYENFADSVENSNTMIIYVHAYRTYTIHIDINNQKFNKMSILVTNIDELIVDFTGYYYYCDKVIAGDEINKVSVKCTGEYSLQVSHNNCLNEEIYFILIKESVKGLEILDYEVLNEDNYIDKNYIFNENDVLYMGYYNGLGLGDITINLSKCTKDTFTIVTDPNSNVTVGSEVNLNSGAYGGLSITQGFTRICYLGNDAPYIQSRTQYYWYSSDENVAKVSAYGTVTATALWTESVDYKTVIISAVYKDDVSIIGSISLTIYKSNDTNIKYLMYGMDVRTGGTISGTEVTSELGTPINVSNSPKVYMHKNKTRLICLGNDSPTVSIQDFTWTTNNSSIATVSQFGTITAHATGCVVIYGVYKYNSNYRVVIEIEVLG